MISPAVARSLRARVARSLRAFAFAFAFASVPRVSAHGMRPDRSSWRALLVCACPAARKGRRAQPLNARRALERVLRMLFSSSKPPRLAHGPHWHHGGAESSRLFCIPSPLQITLLSPKESAMHWSLSDTGLLLAGSALWNLPDRWRKQVAGLGAIVYPARAFLDSVDAMKSRHGSGASSGASVGSADSACACARVQGNEGDEPALGALAGGGRQRAMPKGDSPTTRQALDCTLGMRGLPLSTLRLTDLGPVAHCKSGAQGSSIELTHRPSARASQHP